MGAPVKRNAVGVVVVRLEPPQLLPVGCADLDNWSAAVREVEEPLPLQPSTESSETSATEGHPSRACQARQALNHSRGPNKWRVLAQLCRECEAAAPANQDVGARAAEGWAWGVMCIVTSGACQNYPCVP